MIKVKVGDLIRNNDPKKRDDVHEIIAIKGTNESGEWKNYAVYQANTRKAKVAFDRIFNDGKSRAQGYSLVSGAMVAGEHTAKTQPGSGTGGAPAGGNDHYIGLDRPATKLPDNAFSRA